MKTDANGIIACTPDNPGMDDGYYRCPYIESVEGKRHGYRDRGGVQWTRKAVHPADPKCPECRTRKDS